MSLARLIVASLGRTPASDPPLGRPIGEGGSHRNMKPEQTAPSLSNMGGPPSRKNNRRGGVRQTPLHIHGSCPHDLTVSRRPHPIFAKPDLENPRPVFSQSMIIILGFHFGKFIQPSPFPLAVPYIMSKGPETQ